MASKNEIAALKALAGGHSTLTAAETALLAKYEVVLYEGAEKALLLTGTKHTVSKAELQAITAAVEKTNRTLHHIHLKISKG